MNEQVVVFGLFFGFDDKAGVLADAATGGQRFEAGVGHAGGSPVNQLNLGAASQEFYPGVVDGTAGLAAFAALDVDLVVRRPLRETLTLPVLSGVGPLISDACPWRPAGRSGCRYWRSVMSITSKIWGNPVHGAVDAGRWLLIVAAADGAVACARASWVEPTLTKSDVVFCPEPSEAPLTKASVPSCSQPVAGAVGALIDVSSPLVAGAHS